MTNNKKSTEIIVSGLLEGLQKQKEASEFFDVLVVIDGFEFKCHRVILAACSGFFKAAFTSGMKEDRERKITLKDISREIFAEVLDCVYTGKNIITDSNMYEIWHAANMLEILFLLNACEVILKETIKNDNCLTIYQHSKLLDSKEIMPLSWSFIVKNFQIVRRFEEILMFTEGDMEKLILSPDLIISSEDEIMETVLSWVAYKPTKTNSDNFCDETRELADDCKHDTQVDSQNDSTLTRDNSKVNMDQDDVLAANEQKKDTIKHSESFDRASHLFNLLSLTKVCLLSGKCLIETMSANIVRSDARAREILQEGLEYVLRTDRLHEFCPPSAVRRTRSDLENVIIAINPYNGVDALVCRRQNGQWCGLGIPVSNRSYNQASMTSSNNVVYLAANGYHCIFMYTPFSNQWRETQRVTNLGHLLAIGNFVCLVNTQYRPFQIQTLNVTGVYDVDAKSQWTNIASQLSDLTSITCTTVIGDKIVIIGSVTGKLRIQIVIFDTATLRYFTLNEIPPFSSPAVCFKKGNDSFMLENTGELYRLRACSKAPFIEIKYETKLWNFERTVNGAVVFNDELLLFGQSFSTSDADEHWELSMPGVFKCVKNITCRYNLSGFMHIVIPKMYLTREVSVQ